MVYTFLLANKKYVPWTLIDLGFHSEDQVYFDHNVVNNAIKN